MTVTADDIRFLANWDAKAEPSREIAFMPARVLMQDFTGVPAIVDLAAMRDAMKVLGGDPQKINPLVPAELVIDHSVQVDEYGSASAYDLNAALEFQRNRERYAFLKWGQTAFHNFSAVPPGMGICHQVNLEYLARVVFTKEENGTTIAYPDTLVGTDTHTTMINGLGVLGWGVGGIEAEAAMLGQPVSMLVPQVVGFKLTGKLREGATATDLVLTVTEMLRKFGVVGKFVEFYGPGISELPLADRATIANMAPEYGATCGIFPVDAETLKYLRLTGRSEEQIALTEAYYKAQGLFHTPDAPEAEYSAALQLDLSTVEPSVAGPKRPQDRVLLRETPESFAKVLPSLLGPNANKNEVRQMVRWEGEGGHTSADGNLASSVGSPAPEIPVSVTVTATSHEKSAGGTQEYVPTEHTVRARFGVDPDKYLSNGSIVIAAITSCTNTSNPYVMVAAGLLAKKAVEAGLSTPPWVKTSLAPGSRVVTDYYTRAGLLPYLDKLRFQVVGYGCTTCIGNSGPLPDDVSKSIEEHGLVAVSVLSGNRNFEGRISPEVRANYLMSRRSSSPTRLRATSSTTSTPIRSARAKTASPSILRDIWPTQKEVADAVAAPSTPRCSASNTAPSPTATPTGSTSSSRPATPTAGNGLHLHPQGAILRRHARNSRRRRKHHGRTRARLAWRFVTTDHISPAGSIKQNGPAGKYLMEHGVKPFEFNSYGSRRGNHEVMVRGTFANVRFATSSRPEPKAASHVCSPKEGMSIYDACVEYAKRGTPLCILAGKEYGSGSSRDWAAKGPRLLGIRFVIAESYERIHRSNLVGMGILPLEFEAGKNAESLGLTGEETYDITRLQGTSRQKIRERHRAPSSS